MSVRRLLWLLPGLFLVVLGANLVIGGGTDDGWLAYKTPMPNSGATLTTAVAVLTHDQVYGWVMLGLGLVACGVWGGYVAGERAERGRRPVKRVVKRPVARPRQRTR